MTVNSARSSFRFLSRSILFGLTLIVVVAGQSAGIDDLPSCASSCAQTAATASGCKLTDMTCICAHPDFASATNQCAQSSCPIEDRGTVSGVLSQLCSSQPANTSSSSSSTSSSSQSSSTTANTSSSSSHPQSTPSSSPSPSPSPSSTQPPPTAATPSRVVPPSLQGSSSSSGSTTVVVQTLVSVLPQTSDPALASGAGKFGAGNGIQIATLAFVALGWVVGGVLI